jgi:hypothetical protein
LRELDARVPERVNVRFIERPPDADAIFVLPDLAINGDLSDAALEAVAGGEDLSCPWTCVDLITCCTWESLSV